jgi:hypothetical protein
MVRVLPDLDLNPNPQDYHYIKKKSFGSGVLGVFSFG